MAARSRHALLRRGNAAGGGLGAIPASASLATAVVVVIAVGIGALLWHDTRLGKVNAKLRLAVAEAIASAQDARNQKARAETNEKLLKRQVAGNQISGASRP